MAQDDAAGVPGRAGTPTIAESVSPDGSMLSVATLGTFTAFATIDQASQRG